MTIATTTEKNALAVEYGLDCTHAALFTTAPSGVNPGTEVTGGTYARVALSWGAPSGGKIIATASFNVPAGVTVAGVGLYNALTGGTYLDGATVTSQAFATATTYVITIDFTQI